MLFSISKCLQKNSTQQENSSVAAASQRQNNICLPKFSIEHFDGDPQLFLEFLDDSFRYSVHEKDSIPNVQKMTYLKGLLKGDAASCISGFKITDENYETSVNLLKVRYNNKQLIVSSCITNLLNLPQLNSSDNVNDLRKICDTVETQVRSLENLEIQSEMYGPLIIPVLLPKLSSELSLIINRQFDIKDCWDVRLVLKRLESEIIAREKTHYTSKNLNGNNDLLLSASALHISSDKNRKASQCLFCDKANHKSQFCKTVTDIVKKKEILKKKNDVFVA